MNNLLNYFIEANLYLICFYLIYQFLLSRDKHFRFSRAFLLTGIIASLVLPLVSIDIRSAGIGPEAYIMLPVLTISTAQTESVDWLLQWKNVIAIIYLTGLIFAAIRLLWQITHILWYLPLLNSNRQKLNGYTLITTNGEIPTCSFFKFLFWDTTVNLTDKEKTQILEHELAHIRQWHSIDILFIEILRVIFWFNPAIHFLKSGIAEVHEYLADKEAIKDVGADQYSKLLTLQVFKNFDFALSNNFHKSQVLRRIYMLKESRGKSLWLNIAFLLPLVSVLIALMAFRVDSSDILSVQNSNQIGLANTISTDTVKNQNDEIYLEVDVAPEPSGGMTAFFEYNATNLKYPAEAREAGIEGKVILQFVVDTDGKITNVQSVKGIGYGCDEEAVRVVKDSPAWKPGMKDGKVVKVRMVLPITFKLG